MTHHIYVARSRDGMRTDYHVTNKITPSQDRAIRREIEKDKLQLIEIRIRNYPEKSEKPNS